MEALRVKQTSKVLKITLITGAPKRIRIAVAGLKGRCPRPLDDGGMPPKYSRDTHDLQCPHAIRKAKDYSISLVGVPGAVGYIGCQAIDRSTAQALNCP